MLISIGFKSNFYKIRDWCPPNGLRKILVGSPSMWSHVRTLKVWSILEQGVPHKIQNQRYHKKSTINVMPHSLWPYLGPYGLHIKFRCESSYRPPHLHNLQFSLHFNASNTNKQPNAKQHTNIHKSPDIATTVVDTPIALRRGYSHCETFRFTFSSL